MSSQATWSARHWVMYVTVPTWGPKGRVTCLEMLGSSRARWTCCRPWIGHRMATGAHTAWRVTLRRPLPPNRTRTTTPTMVTTISTPPQACWRPPSLCRCSSPMNRLRPNHRAYTWMTPPLLLCPPSKTTSITISSQQSRATNSPRATVTASSNPSCRSTRTARGVASPQSPAVTSPSPLPSADLSPPLAPSLRSLLRTPCRKPVGPLMFPRASTWTLMLVWATRIWGVTAASRPVVPSIQLASPPRLGCHGQTQWWGWIWTWAHQSWRMSWVSWTATRLWTTAVSCEECTDWHTVHIFYMWFIISLINSVKRLEEEKWHIMETGARRVFRKLDSCV